MRSFFFTILATCLLVSCSQKSIIEYPDSETSNDFISIYSIEKTDTATILRGNVYHRPNYWVSISSGTTLKGKETGKEYKLLSSPDYELDKEIFMPDSGTLPFTLFFEPIDNKDIHLDYIEDGRTDIAGLSLESKKGKYLTKIRGTVKDYPEASRLILAPYNTDARVNKWISVPIVDGSFSYDLISDYIEPYEIIFWNEYIGGGWMPFYFFSDNDEVTITCYPGSEEKRYDAIATATSNKGLLWYNAEIRDKIDYSEIRKEEIKLQEEDKYFTPEMTALFEQARAEKDRDKQMKLYDIINDHLNNGSGFGLTEEAKIVQSKYEELSRQHKELEMAYLNEGNPGLSHYFVLAERIMYARDMEKAQPYIDLYNNKYASLFPDNPLTEKLQLKIGSSKLQHGGQYIDFTAPDIHGNAYTLSDLIESKVAIIDLWASWCGPCRRHSIELIPIYEEFKDKGFTIVGIARESKNTKAMEKAIEQDKYPWINLVELNDEGKIWQKYGAGNGGGIIIMVNRKGEVIAVNPSTEEVREKLAEYI